MSDSGTDDLARDDVSREDAPTSGRALLLAAEDAVVAVVRFVIGFVVTTLLFVFRPLHASRRLDDPAPTRSGWPHPFTFLAVSFFLYFQLMQLNAAGWLVGGGSGAGDVLSVPGWQDRLSDLSFERFLLTTLPATALVLVVGAFLGWASGDQDGARARTTLGATAYAFGAQMTALHIVREVLAGVEGGGYHYRVFAHPVMDDVVAAVRLLAVFYLLAVPVLVLFRWFRGTERPSWAFRIGAVRLVVIAACVFALNAASFGLAKAMGGEFETDVTVSVHQTRGKRIGDDVEITLEAFLHNHGTTRYLVLDRGWLEIWIDGYAEGPVLVGSKKVHTKIAVTSVPADGYTDLGPGEVIPATVTARIRHSELEIDGADRTIGSYVFGISTRAFTADGTARFPSLMNRRRLLSLRWPEEKPDQRSE